MKTQNLLILALLAAPALQAQPLPVYLDETKSIEERVDDALSRMTLDEKIAIIHAQSKFSSPGVGRLGIPELWCTDGPHGIRPDVLWDPFSSVLASTSVAPRSMAAASSIWAKILSSRAAWQWATLRACRSRAWQSA